jgi:hypothetical protein
MSNTVNAKYKILEMPAGLFDRAVAAAHAMDEREGELEDMPSVKIICDWWNANCPDKKLRRAGSFSIYLRDAEDPSKWENMQNGTVFDEDVWQYWAHRCAIPHNTTNVIVEFFAFRSDFIVIDDQCTSIMVDGATEKTMPIEYADEAWAAHIDLIAFEDTAERDFQVALDALKNGKEVTFILDIPGL